jgi:3-deoxy-D-manno-octulosonate 8-phosphate phosphatase (KDO 8-P phosphatase)
MQIPEEILERARKVKMLLLDCDGVLTDGQIIPLPGGEETKQFDVRDGHGIVMARRAGLRIAVISGRGSFAVRARAQELGIAKLHEGAWDKLEAYQALLAEEGLSDEAICYMGDDVTDIPLLRRAGLALVVADAAQEAKRFAHLVTERGGGRGAVREAIELILRAQGRWEEVLRHYLEA